MRAITFETVHELSKELNTKLSSLELSEVIHRLQNLQKVKEFHKASLAMEAKGR